MKDIQWLYDNKSTPLYPSISNVEKSLADLCKRCVPGDYMVVQYSGHGDKVEDLNGD